VFNQNFVLSHLELKKKQIIKLKGNIDYRRNILYSVQISTTIEQYPVGCLQACIAETPNWLQPKLEESLDEDD
jgi:hypothetical protein